MKAQAQQQLTGRQVAFRSCGHLTPVMAMRPRAWQQRQAASENLQPPAALRLSGGCSSTQRPAAAAARTTWPAPHRAITGRAGPVAPHAAAASSPVAALNEQAVGVVIVDHGSRKRDSNQQLVEFGALYQRLTGAHIVEVAHMEIAEPTIEQAIGKCVEAGAKRVVVAPYFLSRGRHIQEDIPALVKEAQAKFGDVACVIADPIGVDPLMAQLISNRVQAAVGGAAAATASGSNGSGAHN